MAADSDSELLDRVGSTYAYEIDTDWGLLHLLFRLEGGNPDIPPIAALYLDGKLATDVPIDLAETVIGRLYELPWLILDQ